MNELDQKEDIGQVLKNRSRIKQAVKAQDRLRAKGENWNGEEEIRKWRKKGNCPRCFRCS